MFNYLKKIKENKNFLIIFLSFLVLIFSLGFIPFIVANHYHVSVFLTELLFYGLFYLLLFKIHNGRNFFVWAFYFLSCSFFWHVIYFYFFK